MVLVPPELVRQIEVSRRQAVFRQDLGSIRGQQFGRGLSGEADHSDVVAKSRIKSSIVGESAFAAQHDLPAGHDLGAKTEIAPPARDRRKQLRQSAMLKIRKQCDGRKRQAPAEKTRVLGHHVDAFGLKLGCRRPVKPKRDGTDQTRTPAIKGLRARNFDSGNEIQKNKGEFVIYGGLIREICGYFIHGLSEKEQIENLFNYFDAGGDIDIFIADPAILKSSDDTSDSDFYYCMRNGSDYSENVSRPSIWTEYPRFITTNKIIKFERNVLYKNHDAFKSSKTFIIDYTDLYSTYNNEVGSLSKEGRKELKIDISFYTNINADFTINALMLLFSYKYPLNPTFCLSVENKMGTKITDLTIENVFDELTNRRFRVINKSSGSTHDLWRYLKLISRGYYPTEDETYIFLDRLSQYSYPIISNAENDHSFSAPDNLDYNIKSIRKLFLPVLKYFISTGHVQMYCKDVKSAGSRSPSGGPEGAWGQDVSIYDKRIRLESVIDTFYANGQMESLPEFLLQWGQYFKLNTHDRYIIKMLVYNNYMHVLKTIESMYGYEYVDYTYTGLNSSYEPSRMSEHDLRHFYAEHVYDKASYLFYVDLLKNDSLLTNDGLIRTIPTTQEYFTMCKQGAVNKQLRKWLHVSILSQSLDMVVHIVEKCKIKLRMTDLKYFAQGPHDIFMWFVCQFDWHNQEDWQEFISLPHPFYEKNGSDWTNSLSKGTDKSQWVGPEKINWRYSQAMEYAMIFNRTENLMYLHETLNMPFNVIPNMLYSPIELHKCDQQQRTQNTIETVTYVLEHLDSKKKKACVNNIMDDMCRVDTYIDYHFIDRSAYHIVCPVKVTLKKHLSPICSELCLLLIQEGGMDVTEILNKFCHMLDYGSKWYHMDMIIAINVWLDHNPDQIKAVYDQCKRTTKFQVYDLLEKNLQNQNRQVNYRIAESNFNRYRDNK